MTKTPRTGIMRVSRRKYLGTVRGDKKDNEEKNDDNKDNRSSSKVKSKKK